MTNNESAALFDYQMDVERDALLVDILNWNGPWLVVATAFHGGGIISKHKNYYRAWLAAKKWRIEDCCCGCCGIVHQRDYESLETQDHNQSWSHDPYSLTQC